MGPVEGRWKRKLTGVPGALRLKRNARGQPSPGHRSLCVVVGWDGDGGTPVQQASMCQS